MSSKKFIVKRKFIKFKNYNSICEFYITKLGLKNNNIYTGIIYLIMGLIMLGLPILCNDTSLKNTIAFILFLILIGLVVMDYRSKYKEFKICNRKNDDKNDDFGLLEKVNKLDDEYKNFILDEKVNKELRSFIESKDKDIDNTLWKIIGFGSTFSALYGDISDFSFISKFLYIALIICLFAMGYTNISKSSDRLELKKFLEQLYVSKFIYE